MRRRLVSQFTPRPLEGWSSPERWPVSSSRQRPSPPQATSTRPSPGTASREPTSAPGAARRRRPCARRTARSSRWEGPTRTSWWRATTWTARSTRASPATAGCRPTSRARTAPLTWRFRATRSSSSVSARTSDGTGHFALARYNPDGSLDPTFSGDGKQTTVFGSFGEGGRPGWRSRATARSSRSASPMHGSDARDFALARYNPNGSLDTSFSGDGKQTTDFGASASRRGDRGGDPGGRQDRRGRRGL